MPTIRMTFYSGPPPRQKPRAGDRRTTKKHGEQVRVPRIATDHRGRAIGYDWTGGRQNYDWVSPDDPRAKLYLRAPGAELENRIMSADFELVPALRAAAKDGTSLCPQYEKDHLCYMAAEEIDRLQARCKALEAALREIADGPYWHEIAEARNIAKEALNP